MSITKLNNLSISAITALPSGVGGKVLQVVSATKTDTASSSSSTFADITGLSVSITPSSASNKILVIGYINGAWDNALAKIGTRIMRDSTAIAIGDTAGSRIRLSGYLYANIQSDSPFVISVNYLDSPSSTSSLTYKWQFSSLDNTGVVYVNRSGADSDSTIQARTASGITVMEIAG